MQTALSAPFIDARALKDFATSIGVLNRSSTILAITKYVIDNFNAF